MVGNVQLLGKGLSLAREGRPLSCTVSLSLAFALGSTLSLHNMFGSVPSVLSASVGGQTDSNTAAMAAPFSLDDHV